MCIEPAPGNPLLSPASHDPPEVTQHLCLALLALGSVHGRTRCARLSAPDSGSLLTVLRALPCATTLFIHRQLVAAVNRPWHLCVSMGGRPSSSGSVAGKKGAWSAQGAADEGFANATALTSPPLRVPILSPVPRVLNFYQSGGNAVLSVLNYISLVTRVGASSHTFVDCSGFFYDVPIIFCQGFESLFYF